jgi:threonine/homoserine/homoserine lactone efflux protein
MDYLAQFTTYIFTLSLAAILPGPGMTGLMFKTLTQGYKNGLIMLIGLITGDLIFLLTSIFY